MVLPFILTHMLQLTALKDLKFNKIKQVFRSVIYVVKDNTTTFCFGLKRLCSCSDLQTTTSSGSSLQTVARIPVIELMPHFC